MIRFGQDVRWASHDWDCWKAVDIDSLKLDVERLE